MVLHLILVFFYVALFPAIYVMEREAWYQNDFDINRFVKSKKHQIASWLMPVSLVLGYWVFYLLFSILPVSRSTIWAGIATFLVHLIFLALIYLKRKDIS
ncbi:MAG: hypothetical protein PUB29_03090 [Bacteroidales bacterium]|nr:hypothetical protein [Bacteroidales bacterium]MDD6184598.1 hypothetical protein [Bacteroidales bacterium]